MRFFQAFCHIFTSPSLASKDDSISEVTSRQRDVASTLHMNNQVTPRSIAYTATQVQHLHITSSVTDWSLLKLVFALGSAQEWKHKHASFHYPSFYNFIVDYLKNPQDETSQRDVNELLKWWNWYDLFTLSLERGVLTSPFNSFLVKFSPLRFPIALELHRMMQQNQL